jgi:hypothetical protein
MAKKNFFQKVLSMISYKKPPETHSFVIPEINEGMDEEGGKVFHIKEPDNSDRECFDSSEEKGSEKTVSVSEKSSDRKKPKRSIKDNKG